MKLKQEIYSEDVSEQVNQALQKTVEKLVSRKLDNVDIRCQECNSKELRPKAENPGNGEIKSWAECSECGEREEIEIDYKDLNSTLKS